MHSPRLISPRLMLTLALALSSLICGGCGSTDPYRGQATGVDSPVRIDAPLVVVDRAGTTHDLTAELRAGRPVVLVFWQSWCGPCLAEAPQLAKDSRTWGDDLAFFGVVPGPAASVDESAIDQAIERFGLPHPQMRDTDLSLTKRFKIDGTPTILILSSGGDVVYRSHELPTEWGRWTTR